MHHSGNRARFDFAEVILSALVAGFQVDTTEFVVGHHAGARRASRGRIDDSERILAIGETGGLYFFDTIFTRIQILKAVVALSIRASLGNFGTIGIEQFDYHSADALFARFENAVVVGIMPHRPAQFCRRSFAKIVHHASGA